MTKRLLTATTIALLGLGLQSHPTHAAKPALKFQGSIYTVKLTSSYQESWGAYAERGNLKALGRTYPLFGWVTALADFNQMELTVFAPTTKTPNGTKNQSWPIGGVFFENTCNPNCAASHTWQLRPVWGHPLIHDPNNKTVILAIKP